MSTENLNNTQNSSTNTTFEVPYDVIPLPSKGILYPSRKETIEVRYLVGEDENILTSPNLLQSGKFIDVLLDRKIRSKEVHPLDLLVGDRNAILIWLRATGYGEMYPITVVDPNTEETFDTEIDLTTLKLKPLGADPDENGYFDFTLPMSKKNIKFRLLTARDEDEINKRADAQSKKKGTYTDILTFKLGTQVMSIDGNSDKEWIHNFVRVMPARDSLALRKYIASIEPGIDLNVTVEVPGGNPIESFLVIGPDFFWPDIRV